MIIFLFFDCKNLFKNISINFNYYYFDFNKNYNFHLFNNYLKMQKKQLFKKFLLES